MNRRSLVPLLFALGSLLLQGRTVSSADATDDDNSARDVLIFTDGEKLIGQVQSATGDSVVFKSDMAGILTVDWKKVKELRSSRAFAVLRKGEELKRRQAHPDVAEGTLSATGTALQVQPGPRPAQAAAAPVTVPLADTQALVSAPEFENAMNARPKFYQDWKGGASFGLALIEATQTSQTYTSAVNLTRLQPGENWLEPANRTIFTFDSAYGKLSQPGTATVKTSILHGTAERDEYFSPRVYVMADAGFDHDYSQGLDLQQSYGGGVGWTAIKRANEQLDLRAEADYVNQQFAAASQNKKLFGSIFSEAFTKTFTHKIVFQEGLSINPAWTLLRASSANGTVSLTIPLLKRIGVTMSSSDTYLNDAPPGFRKNSFLFSTGLTYVLP